MTTLMTTLQTRLQLRALIVAAGLMACSASWAGKTYQVTGPVLSVTDSTIVVQKGKEKWEIAREPSTKVTGNLKVGSKVTVEYTMTAAAVSAKESKKK